MRKSVCIILVFVLLSTACRINHLRAEENGKLITLKQGIIFLPDNIREKSPVVVVAEYDKRCERVLNHLRPSLAEHGLIGIAPFLNIRNNDRVYSSAIHTLKTLVKKAEEKTGKKTNGLFVYSFSKAGTLGAQLALMNPEVINGLTLAATYQPDKKNVNRKNATKVPIFLLFGSQDKVFHPARAVKAKKFLADKGFDVRLDIIPDAGHLDILQKHSNVFIQWVLKQNKKTEEKK